MAAWTPDKTFYPSPRMAMKAPAETVAYVAAFDPNRKDPDAIAVVDVDPKSKSYSTISTRLRCRTPATSCTFRLERCCSCLAPRPECPRRAPLSRGARAAVLAHPHPDTKPDAKKPRS